MNQFEIFAGIDWPTQTRQIAVVDADGKILGERAFACNGEGLVDDPSGGGVDAGIGALAAPIVELRVGIVEAAEGPVEEEAAPSLLKISVFHFRHMMPPFNQNKNQEQSSEAEDGRIPRYFPRGRGPPQEQRREA